MTEAVLSDNESAKPAGGDARRKSGVLKEAAARVSVLPGKFHARQKLLLAALVQNPNVVEAAQAAGVAHSTAHRWLQEPFFQEELARQREAVLTEALEGVKTLASRAAGELGRLLETKDERLRRQVCNDILQHTLKVRELEDLERRIAALEKERAKEALAGNSKKGNGERGGVHDVAQKD